MKVSEISEILDDWMPTSIAEDFDNVGLIVGNPKSLVKNILITLDTTSEVIDEAIKKDCNLIISYHPIIFNGLKKITFDSGYVQKSIINAVKNNSKGRCPVIVGTGTNSTYQTIEWTNQAQSLGADAALIVTPYYNKPTQSGLYNHYKSIAENSNLPIIIYNTPDR